MSQPATPPPLHQPRPTPRRVVAGLLLLLGLIAQILHFTPLPLPSPWVSYLFWAATALLWRDIPRRNRLQAGALALLGGGLLLLSQLRHGAAIDWARSLEGNVYVVAMLVGVSFLGLLGTRPPAAPRRRVTGRRGIAQTWLSVHLLGAILNLSTVFMVGDRLRARGELTTPQLLTLNRGLSSAALWSPFFASMGVALTVAPQMSYGWILAFGLPLALASGLFTCLELGRRFDLSQTPGHALTPTNLLMPSAMAALVLVFHYGLTPGLSIVSLITFLLPAVALASNLPRGPRWTTRRVLDHARLRLPAMRGEISLFLCAGLFTQGLSAWVSAASGGEWVLFAHFGAKEAALSYLAIIASAIAGLHPIIGVSTLASLIDPEGSRLTLLGFVALAAWGVGTAVGPLSGINLSLQGRYGSSGYTMMRHNLGYAALMSLLVVAVIFALDRLL
ncbi:hypothetical protein [Bisbaumannia pacifica]|uniref:Uncharacterized protein n=1 Tax=Bisbaumannia pacifica TaxID=77098 RepID=A0ABD4KVH9_9GAMM|nr:hypothetical protein [Halomonas pacifica]